MGRGQFIVIEGVDGVGKTSAARALVESLRASGRAAHLTSEPSTGPVGVLLRALLQGKASPPPSFEGYTQGPSLPSLPFLFAADRLEHVAFEVEPRLARGEWVISDRYYHSSIAYQALAADVSRILSLNQDARRPDLTFILEASPAQLLDRLSGRGGPKEFYDDPALQLRLAASYRDLPRLLPGERIEFVDAGRPLLDVVDALRARLG